MIGFAGYMAYDRRKFQQDILAIQRETQINKLFFEDMQKTVGELKKEGEKTVAVLTEQAKKDKDLLGSIKKAGIL